MTNLAAHLRDVVRDHPDESALSVADAETTYTQLWAMTGRFAAGLVERGVEPGDAVALYLPNLPQYVASFYGTLRAGGTVVPMNPQYKAREVGELLADSEAVAVVTTTDRLSEIEAVHDETDVRFIVTADGPGAFSTGFSEFIGTDANFDFWELANRDDGAVAALPYTSGTTGDPKGVELTHANLTSNTRAAADLVPDGIGPDDAALGALPLFHIYGLTVVMNATLLNGGTFHPMVQWDAGRALDLVESADIDIFHGVPAMYIDALHHSGADDVDLSSVRLAGVGGSGIPVEVLRQFEEQFDVTIYEGYGLTETSPVTHFNAPAWGRRVGSVGKAIPDVEARVVDDDFAEVEPVEEGPVDEAEADLDAITGELVVAGPSVMNRYHGLPEANDEAFTEAEGQRWFHTGDVAYRDEDGYFYVVDRKTDVVVTGGYNVYPREVEELLFEHEAVADAAVVGIPDERRGETVKAFVVAAPDADVSRDDLREYCMDHLAEYKHPRVVEFVDELPRTSTGKVQKFVLRERLDPAGGAVEEVTAAVSEGPASVTGDQADGDDADTAAGTDDAARTEVAEEGAANEEDREPTAGDPDPAAGDHDSVDDDHDSAAEDHDAADEGIPEDIEEISGVGPTKSETLREAGFDSVADLRAASLDDLAEVDGVGDALAEQIKRDVDDD